LVIRWQGADDEPKRIEEKIIEIEAHDEHPENRDAEKMWRTANG
jgi:hypothetical protein